MKRYALLFLLIPSIAFAAPMADFASVTTESSPFVNVKSKKFGAKGDGVTDDGAAITAALAYAASLGGGTLFFPSGTYAYATSPDFGQTKTNVIGTPTTVFKHTGTGNAFSVIGHNTQGPFGLTFRDIIVQGNANSTNGFFVNGIHHSLFENISVRGCSTTGSGIRYEGGVLNTWINPRVTSNDVAVGALNPIPKYGMMLTGNGGSGSYSTTQIIINPIMEGLTQSGGAGIYYDNTSGNTVIGGVSEGNTNGLIINGHSINDSETFAGLWFEANTNKDVWLIDSAGSSFAGGYIPNLLIEGISLRNGFRGGAIGNIDIASTSYFNSFTDMFITGTVTDNATASLNEFFNTSDGNLGSVASRIRYALTQKQYNLSVAGADNIAIQARDANVWSYSITDNAACTVVNPTSPSAGQTISITIKNGTGGALGTLTWGNAFKMGASWDQPANGKSRTIDFYYNGTNWIEKSRTAADVAN